MSSKKINSDSWKRKMPPVYHKTRELVLQYQASTQKAPRAIKYGMVADAEHELMDAMMCIAFADECMSGSKERVAFIEKAVAAVRRVAIYARVINDCGGMKNTGFHAVINLEADVLKQLASWRKSELNV